MLFFVQRLCAFLSTDASRSLRPGRVLSQFKQLTTLSKYCCSRKSHPTFLQLPPLLSSLLSCIKWSRKDLVSVTLALSVRWLEISGSESLTETSSLTEQLCWIVNIVCTWNSWRDFLRLRLYWWLLPCPYSSWVSLQGLCLHGTCNKNDPAFSCILYQKLQHTVPASVSLSVLSIICSEVLSCF